MMMSSNFEINREFFVIMYKKRYEILNRKKNIRISLMGEFEISGNNSDILLIVVCIYDGLKNITHKERDR